MRLTKPPCRNFSLTNTSNLRLNYFSSLFFSSIQPRWWFVWQVEAACAVMAVCCVVVPDVTLGITIQRTVSFVLKVPIVDSSVHLTHCQLSHAEMQNSSTWPYKFKTFLLLLLRFSLLLLYLLMCTLGLFHATGSVFIVKNQLHLMTHCKVDSITRMLVKIPAWSIW